MKEKRINFSNKFGTIKLFDEKKRFEGKKKILLEFRCPMCEDLLSEPYFIPEIVKCYQCDLTWNVSGDLKVEFVEKAKKK